MDLMMLRRQLCKIPYATSISGNIVIFSSNLSAPLKSCMVGNTVDPEIHLSKRNIIPSNAEYTPSKFINGSGVTASNANYMLYSGYIPAIEEATYSVRINKTRSGTIGFTVPFYNSSLRFMSRAVAIDATLASDTGLYYGTFTVPKDAKYFRFSAPTGSTEIQIEFGSTYTDYDNSMITDIASQIKTYRGQNIIWSESGEITLQYWNVE